MSKHWPRKEERGVVERGSSVFPTNACLHPLIFLNGAERWAGLSKDASSQGWAFYGLWSLFHLRVQRPTPKQLSGNRALS